MYVTYTSGEDRKETAIKSNNTNLLIIIIIVNDSSDLYVQYVQRFIDSWSSIDWHSNEQRENELHGAQVVI